MTALPWAGGWQVHLPTLAATERLAARLAEHLRPGSVVGLAGNLGAGKTAFVQALAVPLGVADPRAVLSPTYALMHEYPARHGALVHIDFYRLHDSASAYALGLEEQLGRQDAVVVVEWANQLPELMPPHTVWLHLESLADGNRVGTVAGCPRPAGL